MLATAENAQARTCRGSFQVTSNALVPLQPFFIRMKLLNHCSSSPSGWRDVIGTTSLLLCPFVVYVWTIVSVNMHGGKLTTYFFLPPTFPALPGLRMRRICAATSPTSCLSIPLTLTLVALVAASIPSTLSVIPAGGCTSTGCE